MTLATSVETVSTGVYFFGIFSFLKMSKLVQLVLLQTLVFVFGDVLENTCNVYGNALALATTSYFDGQCTQVFRIVGADPTSAVSMCNDTVKMIGGYCHLTNYDTVDEMNTLISKNMINVCFFAIRKGRVI